MTLKWGLQIHSVGMEFEAPAESPKPRPEIPGSPGGSYSTCFQGWEGIKGSSWRSPRK